MKRVAVEARNLVKRFPLGGLLSRNSRGYVEALRGVSFKVFRGEVYGLLGPNGAGKTTTVKILSTILDPDEGEAWIAGFNVVSERWEVRRRIGVMLSVERGFYWKLTARENLRYFGLLYGIPRGELRDKIEYVLDLVGLKEIGAADKPFEEMSLGMKARLGLARALLRNPETLILDEPTLGLDPASSVKIRRLLKSLANEGRTILITTHNLHEAEEICDRVALIFRGRIIYEGTPEEFRALLGNTVKLRVKLSLQPANIHRIPMLLSEGVLSGASVRHRSGEVVIEASIPRGLVGEAMEEALTAAKKLDGKILEVNVDEPSLEDVYLKLVGGG